MSYKMRYETFDITDNVSLSFFLSFFFPILFLGFGFHDV